MDSVKEETFDLGKRILTLGKWILFAVVNGILVGLVSVLVVKSIAWATEYRQANTWIIFLLPLGGVVIAFLYHILGRDEDTGTNAVLEAIRSQKVIQLRTTPLIILSTFITHLLGGSSGREGAALQFGGSLGEALGKLFRFNEKDRIVMIMCGMSAAFSAVFGLPISAAIFPMEVVSVGIMHYAALVPCTVSSYVAHKVAELFGIQSEGYKFIPAETPAYHNVFAVCVIAGAAAVVSIVFCLMLHKTAHFMQEQLPNRYLRILLAGGLIIILTMLLGYDYNGIGAEVIERAVNEGQALPWAFVLKMIFTTITLSCGYKGGEIVPSFFIGSTLGCVLGMLLGISPGFAAAIGLICVFCGVTNCPISSLIIACELFGFAKAEYFLLAVGITYVISGYHGLYGSQMIMYSKTEPRFINKKAD